jgi:hypothetical protein
MATAAFIESLPSKLKVTGIMPPNCQIINKDYFNTTKSRDFINDVEIARLAQLLLVGSNIDANRRKK